MFQQKTVQEIVEQILNEHSIVDYEFRTQDAHQPREYCVQYQETNLEFMDRLLAEEGFFYFWELAQYHAKLIITDHSTLGSSLLKPNIEYNPDPSVAVKGQFMYNLDWTEEKEEKGSSLFYCIKKSYHSNKKHF